MLRITIRENDGHRRLELAGRLAGPWVRETEAAWRAGARPPGLVEIDLKEVTGMDDAGVRLLQWMHQKGAHLIAKGVEMTALVDEITRTGKGQKS